MKHTLSGRMKIIAALLCAAGLAFAAGCGGTGSDAADAGETPGRTEETGDEAGSEATGTGAEEGTAGVNADKLAATSAEAAAADDGDDALSAAEADEAETEDAAPASAGAKTLTISATGDCTLGAMQDHGYDGSFNAYYDNYGEDYFFSNVRDIFTADDLTIINLECVLTNATERVDKEYSLKGAPEYVGIMTGSSVDAVSMGNNHTYDYGQEGFDETVSVVDGAGITYAYDGCPGLYVSDDDVLVGIVSANAYYDEPDLRDSMSAEIASLREEGAEVVICCCHWGIEKDYYPSDDQVSLAHALIDAGADLIIGNHPHVLQSVEVYNGKVICYSLGNFCFGGNLNPEDKNTMIYQQTFTIEDGELLTDAIDARIIPCRLSSADTYNDFQPTVASGEQKEEIIGLVNEYSSIFGTASFDAEGDLVSAE